MLRRELRELVEAGRSDARQRPGIILSRVEAKLTLLPFDLDLLPGTRGEFRPSAERLCVEVSTELALQVLGSHRRHAAEEPMRRQHEQARVVHADALHEHEVGGVLGVELPLLRQKILVVAGGLIAVMAVGNEHGLRAHDGRDVA